MDNKEIIKEEKLYGLDLLGGLLGVTESVLGNIAGCLVNKGIVNKSNNR